MPASSAIVSPYDTTARYVRHGHIIRWKGFPPTAAPLIVARFTKSQC